MEKIIVDSKYFNVKDTLECGQTFRFKAYKEGFKVYSLDKCCYAYNQDNFAVIECKSEDKEYFFNYFDLAKDYSSIANSAINSKYEILRESAKRGKGIRILNQDSLEMIFSFMISQNNNIPRIKGIIEKLCNSIGEKKEFLGQEYYSFPSLEKMKNETLEFYKNLGLGYRAEYLFNLATTINPEDVLYYKTLNNDSLKRLLLKIKGIGEKVANCIILFGFNRSYSFPVDTWIEKVYKENFNGKEKDRRKITEWFLREFKDNSGYFQQYLFYYKRSIEKGR